MSINKVEVVIAGQLYSLQSEESSEHMKKVANFINKKTEEVQKNVVAGHLNPTQIQMLSTINIANECLKGKEELDTYKVELEKCSEENLALMERVREMSLEIMKLKTEKIHPKRR